MSKRDEHGRRISVPDRSFIDTVGDIARRIVSGGQSAVAVEPPKPPTFQEQATAAQRALEGPGHTDFESRYYQAMTGRRVETPPVIVDPATASLYESLIRRGRVVGTVTGRMSSRDANISNLPRPAPLPLVDVDYADLERRVLASMAVPPDVLQSVSQGPFRTEYLGTFPPVEVQNPCGEVPLEENFEELIEGEELEVVTRTTTTRSTTRRRRATGRASTPGPTHNAPVYIWAMQSSIPRNGGEYLQYEVRLNEDGSTSCNCPGWIFKKKSESRGCKHTRHVEEEAKDFFQRHQRGEQLPTTAPTEEQLMRAQHTKAGKKAAESGETIKYGRFVELD